MTRLIQFANNAVSRLAANISSSATSISLTPGDGAMFPVIVPPMFSMATLVKVDGTTEVVKVTARTSDTLTVVRAAEPVGGLSVSYAFTAGDKIEARMTSAGLSNELDRLDAAALLGAANKSANYTVVASDISTLLRTNTASGTITITLPQISTLSDDFDTIIAKVSADGNTISVASSGPDTINGANSYVLYTQYQSVWLIADRTTNTWTAVTAANSGANVVVDAFTGSGTAGPFTLSGDPVSKNNTVVVVGGTVQLKSTYTLAGTALTLGGVVAAGVLIEVWWTQPLVIGVPADGSVTMAKLHPSAQYAGFKNRIINGDMRIDQRNSGAAVTPSASVYTLDRWYLIMSQASKITTRQVVDAPAGFYNSAKITVASAFTAGATDYFAYRHPIEANNVSDFQCGLATAQAMTLSFWIKGSVPGTYTATCTSNNSARSYPFTFAVTTGWAKQTITIPGDVTGTWLTGGAGVGINLNFDLGSGANYRGAVNTWATENYLGTSGTVALVANAAATLNITGVQLELGSVATPFEQRSYGAELMLCQRYFTKLSSWIIPGNAAPGVAVYTEYPFPMQMRTTPSVIIGGVSYGNTYGAAAQPGGTDKLRFYTYITATGYGYADMNNISINSEL